MTSERAGGWRTLSKRNAFLIHLALSVLIFMTLVMVMVTLWFPGELFFLDGGWEGLKLVAIIDLILGPALTLVLYSPGKKGVAFDMVCIALFQIAALGYGFYTTHSQRAIAVVYAENQFNTVSHAQYEGSSANLLSRNKPTKNVAALDNRKPAVLLVGEYYGSQAQYMQDLLNGFPQMSERSDRYIPAEGNSDVIRADAITETTLAEEDKKGLVKKALAKQDAKRDISVYRFQARYARGFALYDHDKAKIVDYIKMESVSSEETEDATTTVAESPE